MPLHSPTQARSRERILSFGAAGMGKSNDFYAIADLALKTKSDAHFYILDTDVSAWSMLEDDRFAGLLGPDGEPLNITIEDQAQDWWEVITALKKIKAKMRPLDWLMIDMVTPLWDAVQRAFAEKIFHKDLSDYFIEARAAQKASDKKGAGFEGWKDWPVINSMWNDFATPFILQCRGNLYCTAEQKALNRDTADADTKAMFTPYGFVPVGQKRLPHLYRTILWKRAKAANEWDVTTIKDRGRVKLERVPINDFPKDYLLRTAKWKLAG